MLSATTAAASCAVSAVMMSLVRAKAMTTKANSRAGRSPPAVPGATRTNPGNPRPPPERDDALEREQDRDRGQDDADVPPQGTHVDQHADADEEHADQQPFERRQVDLDL